MNIIRINNDFSYLLTDDQELKDKLWQALRFPQRGYIFSSLYRQKLWDGHICFMNKNGRFLTGLLPEVKAAIKQLGSTYQIVDERQHTKLLHESIDENFLNQFVPKDKWPNGKPVKPIILEDYQVALVNQSLKYRRGIIKSQTGSGKTLIMLAIMKCIPAGVPILFLANRKEIIRQNYKEMINWGFENVGRFDGGNHEPNIITCATLQSLHHLDKILHKFKVLIVDEIHMMMSAKAIKTYKKLTGADIRIGVSATPFKFEQKKKNQKTSGEGDKVHKYGVKGYFGPVFNSAISTEVLQDRGRLSKSRCIFYPIDEPQIFYDVYIDSVTNGIAQNWHFHQVVKGLVQTLKGRTLILVERLAHGDTLQKLIPGALWIQGKDNEESREYVIKQLQEATGNVVAIATHQIFNVAVNVFCHNFINAAGGKAEHDIIQRVGRGLRPADDKEILNYYDFIFRINPYLEKHSNKRLRILKEEGHEVIIKEKFDFSI